MPKIGDRFNPHRMFNGVFIPDAVYRHERLSPVSKLIYGRLCRYKGERGEAYPAASTLAEELGITSRQVFTHLDNLAEESFIEREPRPGSSTVYHFLWNQCFEDPNEGMKKTSHPDKSESGSILHGGCEEKFSTSPEENFTQRESLEESQLREKDIPPSPFETQNKNIDPETGEEYERPRYRSRLPGKKVKPPPDPNSVSERLRRMRENAAAGSQDVTGGTWTPSASHPPSPTQPAAPYRDPVALWNAAVPSKAVAPGLYANGRRPQAFLDPTFQESLDQICEKSKALIDAGADLTFDRLFRKDRSGMEGWVMLLSGGLDWLAPKSKDKKGKDELWREQYRS